MPSSRVGRSALLVVVLLCAHACGAKPRVATAPPDPSGAPEAVGPRYAMLLRRPVAARPLAADQQRVLDALEALLAQPPLEVAPDATLDVWDEVATVWIQRRMGLAEAAAAALGAMAKTDERRLFVAITTAVVRDTLLDAVHVTAPPSIGERAAAVYRASIEQFFAHNATLARADFETCAALAPAAEEPLRAWEPYCRERLVAIDELLARVAAMPRDEPALLDCRTKHVYTPLAPVAAPPDRSVPPVVAVLYDGDRLGAADAKRVVAAVTKQVRPLLPYRFLAPADVAKAEALVKARKVTRRGPACGVAPPLTAVLGAAHRHVIAVTVTTYCQKIRDQDDSCGVRVWFSRLGTSYEDRGPLPDNLRAPVANDAAPDAAWVAAADHLEEETEGGFGLMIPPPRHERLDYRVIGYEDDDPWLRPYDLLRDRRVVDALAACVDAPGSFDVALDVSKAGATTAVKLTPVTAPRAGSTTEACLQRVLGAIAWPCPGTGAATSVGVRMCVAPRAAPASP